MSYRHDVMMQPGGVYDQLLVAVYSAPEKRLHQLSVQIWSGSSDGSLSAEAFNRLGEAIERRREFFKARRQVGAARRRAATWRVEHPQDDAEKKRRHWSMSGALPGELRSMFTPGEMAVAAVIRAEFKRKGRCTLPYHLIAKAAGLRSTTVVKRFIRQAKKHGLIKVEERFGDRGLNRPNVITITSREWLRWIAYEGSALQGGTTVPTDLIPRRRKERDEHAARPQTAFEREKAAAMHDDKQPRRVEGGRSRANWEPMRC